MQSMASAHEPFFKKEYCTHQNRGIAGRSVVPKRFAPDPVQGRPNLSVFPHRFHIPFLNLCFLISMVHEVIYESMDWQLSVILFVALLLEELNGETLTYQGDPGACSPEKI